jgi:hypothetical protein
MTDRVQLNERVDAPLKIHLKRKNWDPEASKNAASERCKKASPSVPHACCGRSCVMTWRAAADDGSVACLQVFMRQMQDASSTAARGPAAAKQQRVPGVVKAKQLATAQVRRGVHSLAAQCAALDSQPHACAPPLEACDEERCPLQHGRHTR